MSESTSNGTDEDTVLSAAQVETDSVCVVVETDNSRQSKSEAVTVIPAQVAVSNAAHRDVAELVARNDAYIRHATEQAMINVQKRAEQARFDARGSKAENRGLREKLLSERKSASNATFGLLMVSLLVVVGLIAGAIWYFSAQNSATAPAASGSAPGVVAATTSNAKSTDVSAPARLPAAIHVDADPIVDTPTVEGETVTNETGDIGGSEATAPVRAAVTVPARNLSGAALGTSGSNRGTEATETPAPKVR